MSRALVLRLSGLPIILYGADCEYTPPDGYTAHRVLQLDSFTPGKSALPEVAGIGKASVCTIAAADRQGILSRWFRTTFKGANTVRLQSGLSAELGTLQALCAADSAHILPGQQTGLLYVGLETLRFDGRQAQAFDLSERGALDSQVSAHFVDGSAIRRFAPVLSDRPVYHAQRGAVLSEHRTRSVAGRSFVDPAPVRTIAAGVLQVAPEPDEADPYRFVFAIADALQYFDKQIGTQTASTTLVNGWHYSDGARANKLYVNEYIPEDAVSGGGFAQTLRVTADRAAGAGTVTVNSVVNLAAAFSGQDNNPGPPFQVKAVVNGTADAEWSTATAIDVPTRTLTLVPDNMQAINTGLNADDAFIITEAVLHVGDSPIELAEGLHAWPSDIIAAYNAQANSGANGVLHFLQAQMSADATALSVSAPFRVTDKNPPCIWPARQLPHPGALWYPLLRLPENDPIDSGQDQLQRPQVTPNPPNSREDSHLPATADAAERYAYAPPALAFWQGGRYLLIADPVLPPAPGYLRALRKGESAQGGRLTTVLQYVDVAEQQNAAGNTIGYRVEIAEQSLREFDARNAFPHPLHGDGRFGPFGNWSGQEPVQISAYAPFVGDPRTMLLQVMLSGSGTAGFPTEYSTLPDSHGLGIPAEYVDIEGIASFPVPDLVADLDLWQQEQPIEARALFDGILHFMCAAVVPANVNGARKLTLVDVRAIDRIRSRGTIANADWQDSARPGAGYYAALIGRWQFGFNWSDAEGKFLRTPTLNDRDVLETSGGNAGNSPKMQVKGLQLASDLELSTVYQALRARFGKQALALSGNASYNATADYAAGDTVQVQCSDAINELGQRGLDAPAQILSIEPDPIRAVCKLIVFAATQLPGYYAPVADVVAVDPEDDSRLQLSAQVYARVGLYDWQWFLLAQATLPAAVAVECVHVGSEQNNTDNSLSAFEPDGWFSLSAPHGLAVGDRVRAAGWSLSAAHLRLFAFLAANADTAQMTNPAAPVTYYQ